MQSSHKFMLVISLLMFLIVLASVNSLDAPTITFSPEPEIKVIFNENVTIVDFSLMRETNSDYMELSAAHTADNREFNITVNEVLPNDEYLFSIRARDRLNNVGEFTKQFVVNSSAPVLALENPSYGVSATDTFDLRVKSSISASCNYSTVFDRPIDRMKEFSETGGKNHVVPNFKLEDPKLFVKCIDVYGKLIEKSFILRLDLINPTISAKAQPNLVVENASGYAQTIFEVDSDEPVICRYADRDISYSGMNNFAQPPKVDGNYFFSKEHGISFTYPEKWEPKSYLGLVQKFYPIQPQPITNDTLSISVAVPQPQNISIQEYAPSIVAVYQNLGFSILQSSFNLVNGIDMLELVAAKEIRKSKILYAITGGKLYSVTFEGLTRDYDDNVGYFDDTVVKTLRFGILEGSDSYTQKHRQLIQVPLAKQSYTYYVQCEDLAERMSEKMPVVFQVDPDQGIVITVNNPPQFTSNTTTIFDLTTNEDSFCSFRLPGQASPTSFGEGVESKSHIIGRGTQTSGSYSVDFYCQSSKNEKTITYNYIIDTTPITNISFQAMDNITCGQGDGWRLVGKWTANDPESGDADLYEYTVTDLYETLYVNTTTTSLTEVTVDKDLNGNNLNFTIGRSYYFNVRARNKAGIWSEPVKSQAIVATNKSERECNIDVKPTVRLVTAQITGGITVAIECSDKVGCDLNRSLYGYIRYPSNETCTPLNVYREPVELNHNVVFCYQVYNVVGNYVTGEEIFDISARDTDGDGIPDVNDDCPATPVTETALIDSFGCAPSEKDSDKDGVPDIQDSCPDSEIGLNRSYIDSNGCYIDTDSDKMPDFWEDRYDFNKTDTADANLDADGDDATNLEEYMAGTDPRDSLSYPSKDADNDGVPDADDKCPNTQSGASVNLNGCPDSDKDGIFDDLDKCPNDGGRIDETGCPVSVIPWIFLMLGVILLFGGAGYLAYKLYGRPVPEMAAPSSLVTRPSVQRSLQQRPIVQQRYDQESYQRVMQRAARKAERQRAFEGAFGEKKVTKESADIFEKLTNIEKPKVSVFDRLSLLTGKNKEPENFEKLSKIADSVKDSEAFERLERFKKKGEMDFLHDLSKVRGAKVHEDAIKELEHLAVVKKVSEDDVVKMLGSIQGSKQQILNVFEVLVKYLLKEKKISKHDLSRIMFNLVDRGILSKKDITEVLARLRQ